MYPLYRESKQCLNQSCYCPTVKNSIAFCLLKLKTFLQSMRLVEGKTFAFETNLLLFRLLEPCDGCAAPYGYKHHMPLNTDTSAFSVSYFHSLFDFVILWYVYSMHFVVAILFLSSLHQLFYVTFLDQRNHVMAVLLLMVSNMLCHCRKIQILFL